MSPNESAHAHRVADHHALPPNYQPSTALLTDMYELTMLQASIMDGTVHRSTTFEVFTRRLPNERRYGVVAGTARVLDAVRAFRFTPEQLEHLDFLNDETRDYLAQYSFSGNIDGYREGELYFPDSPILSVSGTFGECVILETLILSILNADSAVASAAARMVTAADGRPIIEMGSRRTHEYSAVTASRAAYLAGFSATSNLEAAFRYGIPASGTAAHAWTLLHINEDGTPNEEAAFRAQIEAQGTDTVLLVDTFDISKGVDTALRVAGTSLGGIRIDSGDLGIMSRRVRKQLDDAGATSTRIVVSSDLDEFAIAGLRGDPVDVFGVGTSVVTGSQAPTAGLVYKLVEVNGHPVAKRSKSKASHGGAKQGFRRTRSTGTAIEEIIAPASMEREVLYEHFHHTHPTDGLLSLTVPLMRAGQPVPHLPTLHESRDFLARQLVSLPWEGLALSRNAPAIPTRYRFLPHTSETL